VLTIADQFAKGGRPRSGGTRRGVRRRRDNVTRSLAVALLRLGVNVTIGAPPNYQLVAGGAEDPSAVEGPGLLRLTASPSEAVKGADVIYTDAWVSMGMEPRPTNAVATSRPFGSKKTFSSSPSGAPC